MNENSGIMDFKTIISRSFKLLKRHWVIYFLPIAYFVISGVVLSILGCFAAMFLYVFTVMSLMETKGLRDVLTTLTSGAAGFLILGIILPLIFVSGYIGGLGQALKELLKNERISIRDFNAGVFRHGPRLFFGGAVMIVLLVLPFYWGFIKLMHIYGIYDFATMQNGWNFPLRESLTRMHSGVVLLTYLIDFIITILFGFWWIISIDESRNFIVSFVKSVIVFGRNPIRSISVIVGNLFGLYLAAFVFGALLGLIGLPYLMGMLFGLFLFLPVTILTMLQFYNPSLRKELATDKPAPVWINLSEVKE